MGLGVLHNDGNASTATSAHLRPHRLFSARDQGHRFALMFDLISKARPRPARRWLADVDLDTLDAVRLGWRSPRRYARGIKRSSTPTVVINSGCRRLSNAALDTVVPLTAAARSARKWSRQGISTSPTAFLAEAEEVAARSGGAFNIGSVAAQQTEFDPATVTAEWQAADQAGQFLPVGALQTDVALLSADALLFGLEFGRRPATRRLRLRARPGATAPARPSRSLQAAALEHRRPRHRRRPSGLLVAERWPRPHHNFMSNRSFNVDMILFRNLSPT